MAISRNAKTGGGTSVNSGQVWNADDVNVDMDTLFNKLNSGILNADVAAGAGIVYSKLSLASSIVSADIVDGTIVNVDIGAAAAIAATKLDDISATDDAHDDTATPGVSGAHTLPTTGSGELQQLRYAIERMALGVAASRIDAAPGTTFWGDLPARSMQWLPGINGTVTAGLPVGWTNVNTATLAQEAANLADATAGKGRAIKCTAAGGANEGISFTLSGLKSATRYLIVAIAKATAGDTAKLLTTGADAASSFRNLTGVGSAATTATAWTPIFGVIQTDATPTNIVVQCVAAADTDIVWFSHVGYAECAAAPVAPRVAVVRQMIASTAGTVITGSTTDAGLTANYQFVDDGTNDLDLTVYVPGDGYYIEVLADFNATETTATGGNAFTANWRIYQSVNGGALSSARARDVIAEHDGGDNQQTCYADAMSYVVESPTPGVSYRFAVAATKAAAGAPTLTPQLGSTGSSSLTVKVLPYGG